MRFEEILAPSLLDLDRSFYDLEAIRERNPQRYEMEMLDRIVHLDTDNKVIAAVKEVRSSEFWVRGHFPAEPIMPGVLMIEAAGQLCSFYFREINGGDDVMGFASADGVKFRAVVRPGDRFLIVGKMLTLTLRRARFRAEGFVGERRVFDAEITGLVLR